MLDTTVLDKERNKILFNMMVVGESGVGKTALVNQFVDGIFIGEHDPTIEDKHKKLLSVDNTRVLLEILDTAGQKQLAFLREQHYLTTEAFIIVFSVTSRQSFIEAVRILHQIFRIKGRNIPITLLGNKCDLVNEREIEYKEITESLSFIKGNITYCEGSAKDDESVSAVFAATVRNIRKSTEEMQPNIPSSMENSNSPRMKHKRSSVHDCSLM